jgi:hypothetical protein
MEIKEIIIGENLLLKDNLLSILNKLNGNLKEILSEYKDKINNIVINSHICSYFQDMKSIKMNNTLNILDISYKELKKCTL